MARILIAEDVASIAEILRLGLEREGFEVVVVNDGDLVLPIALSGSVDLALLDICMPRMDGMTVLRAIRASRDLHLPVIMLTANITNSELAEGTASGAYASIIKPFKISDVTRQISRMLSN